MTAGAWLRSARGVRKLRRHLAGREDSEHVQAIIRIGFGVLFALYLYFTIGPRPDVALFFIGFELVSFGIFLAILAYPQPSAPRRRFGTVVDMATTTGVMLAYGEVGAPLYGIYLWVTFGNGFRYGARSLYASQVMSLAGFGAVVTFTPFWQQHPLLTGGLMVLLAALPVYGAVLLTALASANRSLHDQAMRDVLTGLYNRRYLVDAFERELHRAKRRREGLAVMVIDIDHFKRFNDDFGHAAGDEVLRSVAQVMLSLVRLEDILCRFGGEEFVLIQAKASRESVMQRADSLRQTIGAHIIEYDGERVGPVTLSIGVAVFPDHGRTTQEMLEAADDALYRAKHSGRNRVVMAETPGEAAAEASTAPSPRRARS